MERTGAAEVRSDERMLAPAMRDMTGMVEGRKGVGE